MSDLFRVTAVALSLVIAFAGPTLRPSSTTVAATQVESQKRPATSRQPGASGSVAPVREYPIPTPASIPAGIAQGPDGAVWFAEYGSGKIGRLTIAGDVREFTIPTAGSGPQKIVVGPDGALWFTETDANKIGRITVDGAIREFPVPTPTVFRQ